MAGWKQLSRKIVYENKWLRVHEDQVINPLGEQVIYGTYEPKDDAVYVTVFDDQSRLCLVEQYRYPLQSNTWEVIAGHCDEDTPLVAAHREMIEESGYEAQTMQQIATLYDTTGLSNSKFHLFVARGIIKKTDQLDPADDIIQVKFFSENEIIKMIFDGTIKDGQTIASVLMAFKYIKEIHV